MYQLCEPLAYCKVRKIVMTLWHTFLWEEEKWKHHYLGQSLLHILILVELLTTVLHFLGSLYFTTVYCYQATS